MIEFDLLIFVTLGIIAVFLVFYFFLKPRAEYPYYTRETLLTKAELNFYKVLQKVIDKNHTISCKVRLADIINCSDANWHKGYGPKISSKHIDFLLTNSETSKILLCIELDDSSHALPNRKKRDIFVDKSLNAADVPILRIKAARGYDMAFIQKEVNIALN